MADLNKTSSSDTHKYGEAFMRMLYRTDDGTEEEWIWNSRNGVTPFVVSNRAGTKQMTHVEWNRDQLRPDYKPQPGERIFVTLTEGKAREYATDRVARTEAAYKKRLSKKERTRIIEGMVADWVSRGQPDIEVVK